VETYCKSKSTHLGRGSLFAVDLGPEVHSLLSVVVLLHGGISWLPGGWAHITMLVGPSQGFHEAENLFGITADWQVVHGVLSEDALLVDDVSGTESRTTFTAVVFDVAAVSLDELLVDVGEEGDLHWANTTVLAFSLGVLSVNMDRVDGGADELAVSGLEFLGHVVELADLGWAHECEVEWPEEEDDVFAC